MCIHQTSNSIVVVECDHNALPANERDESEIIQSDGNGFVPSTLLLLFVVVCLFIFLTLFLTLFFFNFLLSSFLIIGLSIHDDEEEEEEEEEDNAKMSSGEPKLTTQQVGHARPLATSTSTATTTPSWASCVRVLSPTTGTTLDSVELPTGDAAFTVTSVVFKDRGGEEFVVVGTAHSLSLHPTHHHGGALRVYRYIPNKQTLMLVHSTDIESVPLALAAFDGHLVVGLGSTLRLYSMGKKRLLRKCELRNFPTMIRTVVSINLSFEIFFGFFDLKKKLKKKKKKREPIIFFFDKLFHFLFLF